MKRIFPFFAFFFISCISFAQYENFDLSKYKLPDMKRHQLNLKVNLSNSYSNKNDIDNDAYVNSSFSEQFGMNYRFFQNTQKLQQSYYSSFSSNFEFNKSTDEDVLQNKEKDFSSHFHVNLDNRFYLHEEKFFIHLEPSVTLYYRHDKEKSKVYNQNHDYINRLNKDLDFAPIVNLGVGYGRIEPVGDLRHAIYILEEFEKNGITSGVATDEDVLAIARRASELKNKRFFDARIRKIYEIKSLDSLLQELNLVEETDAVYYTVLNDMWDYGNETRQSGNRIQIDINGGWNYSKDKNAEYINEDTMDDDEEHSAKIGTKLNFDSYKPIGLKWERFIRLEGSYLHRTRPNIIDESEWLLDYLGSSDYYGARFSYGYKWFRNTRTSISFGTNGYYSKSIQNSKKEAEYEHYGINFESRVNYYFSPRLRLYYNLNLGYSISDGFHDFDKWDDARFNFSNRLTLNYAIF